MELFLVDIDGCLRGEGRTILSTKHYEAQRTLVKYIEAANRGVVPPLGGCTGRDFGSTEAMFINLLLPDTWTLYEGGACAANLATGKVEVNPRITQEKQEALEEARHKWLPQFLEIPHLSLYRAWKDWVITLEFHPNTPSPVRDEIGAEIEDSLSHLKHILQMSMSSIAFDIGVVDKGHGALWVGEMTGIEPSNMVGIEDSRGGIPLLRAVGHPASVGNGASECKDIAEFTADESHAAGVWEIIRYYLKEADIPIPFLESAVP